MLKNRVRTGFSGRGSAQSDTLTHLNDVFSFWTLFKTWSCFLIGCCWFFPLVRQKIGAEFLLVFLGGEDFSSLEKQRTGVE